MSADRGREASGERIFQISSWLLTKIRKKVTVGKSRIPGKKNLAKRMDRIVSDPQMPLGISKSDSGDV